MEGISPSAARKAHRYKVRIILIVQRMRNDTKERPDRVGFHYSPVKFPVVSHVEFFCHVVVHVYVQMTLSTGHVFFLHEVVRLDERFRLVVPILLLNIPAQLILLVRVQ